MQEGFYFKNYKASERLETRGEKTIEIDYTVSVNLVEARNGEFIVAVKTSDFKKNGQTPDDKMSLLSIACIASISPISLLLSSEGQVKGFHDYQGMLQRFEGKRSDLEEFFMGDVARQYLDQFQADLQKEKTLLKQFCSTLLYQSLFLDTEWLDNIQKAEADFYVLANSFSITCHLTNTINTEDTDEIVSTIEGQIKEDCSLQELLKGRRIADFSEENVKGEIILRYTRSKQHKQLLKVESTIVLLHDELSFQEHKLVLHALESTKPEAKFSTLFND